MIDISQINHSSWIASGTFWPSTLGLLNSGQNPPGRWGSQLSLCKQLPRDLVNQLPRDLVNQSIPDVNNFNHVKIIGWYWVTVLHDPTWSNFRCSHVFSSLLALQVALQAGRRKVHSSPVLFWAGGGSQLTKPTKVFFKKLQRNWQSLNLCRSRSSAPDSRQPSWFPRLPRSHSSSETGREW